MTFTIVPRLSAAGLKQPDLSGRTILILRLRASHFVGGAGRAE
jgi:hypothetical protein